MGIAEDLQLFEAKLRELITAYEQYFIGLEKREPVKQLDEVEKLVRRYANTPINNTMHKHRYNGLVARLNSYRQHWTRILREMEEGRYSRDRFRAKLHATKKTPPKETEKSAKQSSSFDADFEKLYSELEKANSSCKSGVGAMTREQLAATIAKQKPILAQKLGTDEIRFRVVVEDGKPKIKAGLKPKAVGE